MVLVILVVMVVLVVFYSVWDGFDSVFYIVLVVHGSSCLR